MADTADFEQGPRLDAGTIVKSLWKVQLSTVTRCTVGGASLRRGRVRRGIRSLVGQHERHAAVRAQDGADHDEQGQRAAQDGGARAQEVTGGCEEICIIYAN